MLQAPSKKVRSGLFSFVTGVGTVIIKISQSLIESSLLDNDKLLFKASFNFFSSTSFVISIPNFREYILFELTSKPTTLKFKESFNAKGKPTYPSPIMAIFFWRVLLSMTYVLIFIKNDTFF